MRIFVNNRIQIHANSYYAIKFGVEFNMRNILNGFQIGLYFLCFTLSFYYFFKGNKRAFGQLNRIFGYRRKVK